MSIGLAGAVIGRDESSRHAAAAADLDPDKTVVERAAELTGLSSLPGAKHAQGTLLSLSALGDKAAASASLCSVTTLTAYTEDPSGIYGNS